MVHAEEVSVRICLQEHQKNLQKISFLNFKSLIKILKTGKQLLFFKKRFVFIFRFKIKTLGVFSYSLTAKQ